MFLVFLYPYRENGFRIFQGRSGEETGSRRGGEGAWTQTDEGTIREGGGWEDEEGGWQEVMNLGFVVSTFL